MPAAKVIVRRFHDAPAIWGHLHASPSLQPGTSVASRPPDTVVPACRASGAADGVRSRLLPELEPCFMRLASWLFVKDSQSIWVERLAANSLITAGPGPTRQQRDFISEAALEAFQMALGERLAADGWFLWGVDRDRRRAARHEQREAVIAFNCGPRKRGMRRFSDAAAAARSAERDATGHDNAVSNDARRGGLERWGVGD